MKVTISHPNGNANVRAILAGLRRTDSLYEFYTTLAVFPGSVLGTLAHIRPFADLKRRKYDTSLRSRTRVWPGREVCRLISSRNKWDGLFSRENAPFSVDAVYKSLDKKVASGLEMARKNGLDTVYAYEDGALETFTKAKELGMTCVYDLPIAFWKTTRKLIQQEADRMPQWAATLGGGISDSQQKLDRKSRELELADIVVTPSNFVAGSLQSSIGARRIITAHFGSPPSAEGVQRKVNRNRPLRILFAGSMGQRKGLGDLFEAVKSLNTNRIELVVMGSLLEKLAFYKRQLPAFTYEPPRAHAQVLKLMSECDVFCLPSIIEGRALVMQEAMSQGMPLIITPNTGGDDLIAEGETGFLVPIRAPHLIAEKLEWFLDNRESIPEMGRNASGHAATYTWQNYADTVVRQIGHSVNTPHLHF